MILKGKLYAESPIYRGNARKTLFTRDGDGKERLVSLAGDIAGTAESLMDAFIGRSRRGNNIGLLDRLWLRLYGSTMPQGLIKNVDAKLQKASYPRGRLFDLRMGIKLDEDRWAAEANANYKMETLFRNSVFDFAMQVNDSLLQQGDNAAKLYYLLQELAEGRFWFGAGKSKGLGRCRLEVDAPLATPAAPPRTNPLANHLRISLTFDATNPVLVGWNWGKVDPDVPSFAAVEGHLLVEAMRDLPDAIRERLEMGLSGPILSPADWKRKLATYLPRVIAIWLRERSTGEVEVWVLPLATVRKLSKGKYALSRQSIADLKPLIGKLFPSRGAAEESIKKALGKKANMAGRVLRGMQRKRETTRQFDEEAWAEMAAGLGLPQDLGQRLAAQIQDEAALLRALTPACQQILPRLYEQADQQINLLQSDAWVDAEIATRMEHLRIKTMLRQKKITERQWGDSRQVPQGVSPATWREFLESHRRVRYRHMLAPRNLNKSITNDQNFIAFLKNYRERTRQELSQPHHIDFRIGGRSKREVSRKYGKSYDTVFMRMLSWTPSAQESGAWEVYVPGSTIKGAFRKRASQVLKTLWGDSKKTNQMLDSLFGAQGRRGLVFFSDAYLTDPLDPNRAWCSMDGVKMDPKTGRPLETAKHDYLFAYGDQLAFQLQMDVQDIGERDQDALSLLLHLLQDFQRGEIPLGGEKTVGFGWVKATVASLSWLTTEPAGMGQTLFGPQHLGRDGIWHKLELEGPAAAAALQARSPLTPRGRGFQTPPKAQGGFISHRSFGGHCGTLVVEAEVLTPLHVRESGQSSFKSALADGPINGWDFFSMSPPEAAYRDANRVYALPSRSLKGMLRHIYTIASDARAQSSDVGRLNPADGLFGWVGSGQNQAIMGRLSTSFGLFDQPELAWFKVPYPYGRWRYVNGRWQQAANGSVSQLVIANTWRLFPHAPLAPIAQRLDQFQPNTAQAGYSRYILPGARARFSIRFWNLEQEELQRLIWCVALEPNLAHKMGKNRYVGFGSLRLHILPESFLIDWEKRYAGGAEQEWRRPLQAAQWLKPGVVRHYQELRKALNANQL